MASAVENRSRYFPLLPTCIYLITRILTALSGLQQPGAMQVPGFRRKIIDLASQLVLVPGPREWENRKLPAETICGNHP
jgi:hypothetical protein